MEFGLGIAKFVPLIVYICGVAVLLLTLFYRIEIGIFFMVPLFPLQNVIQVIHKYPFGKDFFDILLLAMMVKWISNKMKDGDSNFFIKTPINLIILMLIFWTYLELWFGSSYLGLPAPIKLDDFRFVQWKNFMTLPLIFLIVVNNIKNPKHIRILVYLMILSMMAVNQSTFRNLRWQDKSHYSDQLGTQGTFTYLGRAELAIFYAQYTMFFLSLFLSDNDKWRRILIGLLLPINFYCLLFSYARSGYLGALTGLTLIGFLKNKVVLACLLIFLFFWKAFVPGAVIERVEMTKSEEGNYDTTSTQRINMWNTAMEIIYQNPIKGIGYYVIPFIDLTDGMSQQARAHVHNAYVQTLAELGLVGMLLFLLFFIYCIRIGWRLYRISDDGFYKGLGLGLVTCTISNMAGNVFGYNWHYLNVMGFFWVILALVIQSTMTIESKMKESLNSKK